MDVIDYENFDWIIYVRVNKDLKKNDIINKESAWKHWKNHGCIEERPVAIINNTNIHNGRLGNIFFVNMVAHFISVKINLKCRYKYYSKFEKLGIYLHIGNNVYEKNRVINDNNFFNIIKNESIIKTNIIINNNNWFQTHEFSLFLKSYFSLPYNQTRIIENNIFQKRYKNNNDLFIHIRLGDIEKQTSNMSNYYESLLSTNKFVTGYIASDSIQHSLCQNLIDKYNLLVINKDEIETIMFGSTCNIIILAGGTFSWLIGFFAFFSEKIYYPDIKNPWYGDIFRFNHWNSVNL
jgi:hypothetical protein